MAKWLATLHWNVPSKGERPHMVLACFCCSMSSNKGRVGAKADHRGYDTHDGLHLEGHFPGNLGSLGSSPMPKIGPMARSDVERRPTLVAESGTDCGTDCGTEDGTGGGTQGSSGASPPDTSRLWRGGPSVQVTETGDHLLFLDGPLSRRSMVVRMAGWQ